MARHAEDASRIEVKALSKNTLVDVIPSDGYEACVIAKPESTDVGSLFRLVVFASRFNPGGPIKFHVPNADGYFFINLPGFLTPERDIEKALEAFPRKPEPPVVVK